MNPKKIERPQQILNKSRWRSYGLSGRRPWGHNSAPGKEPRTTAVVCNSRGRRVSCDRPLKQSDASHPHPHRHSSFYSRLMWRLDQQHSRTCRLS